MTTESRELPQSSQSNRIIILRPQAVSVIFRFGGATLKSFTGSQFNAENEVKPGGEEAFSPHRLGKDQAGSHGNRPSVHR